MLIRYLPYLIVFAPALLASSLPAGCGATSWAFDSTNNANQTVGDRSFLVHIPADYDANTTHPVVLSFHGYGEDDKAQERSTGLSNEGYLIDKKGIIAVYPLAAYGPGKHRQPVRAWMGAPYSPPDVDDFAFVDALLGELHDNLCVDSQRIYASGMSNVSTLNNRTSIQTNRNIQGGGFVRMRPVFFDSLANKSQVNLLACSESMAPKFAAFAPVSPALYSGTHPFKSCNPGQKIPMINFHGMADRIVPYDGRNVSSDAAYDTAPIAQWREGWVTRNGCDISTPSNVSYPYHGVIETTWQCGNDTKATFKAFEIKNGTHVWPSMLEVGFDATSEQILPFFEQYTTK
ncbi:hypothetical protein C8J57DRAFT_1495353 [Mycena rebaudengoi]|nr:hypothetical protein C8J57DRAFT_1495353 [Mycena rebaudengoi]